jgi:hypothetical protein
VHGPVRKTGDDAFTFPLGDTTLHDSVAYHPLAITAPSNSSDRFQATYLPVVQTNGSTLVDTLEGISACDHWTLDRQVGSSNVKATLGWNENCVPTSLADKTIAVWDGTKWVDAGVGSSTLAWPTGTITSALDMIFVSNQATITTGIKKAPYKGYAILKKELDGNYYRSYNSLWFKFDDEYNDAGSVLTFTVREAATNDIVVLLGTANNTQTSVYGDNRFKLDLYTSSGPLASGFYVLEVTNEKNEKWYLRFKN